MGSVAEVERRLLPEAAAPAREGMDGAGPRVPARRDYPNPPNLGSGTNGPDGPWARCLSSLSRISILISETQYDDARMWCAKFRTQQSRAACAARPTRQSRLCVQLAPTRVATSAAPAAASPLSASNLSAPSAIAGFFKYASCAAASSTRLGNPNTCPLRAQARTKDRPPGTNKGTREVRSYR